MIKKTIMPILFCIMILICSSCGEKSKVVSDSKKEYAPGDVIYENDDVKVTVVEKNPGKVDAYYDWLPVTDEFVYDETTLIMSGKISNVREAIAEFTNEEYPSNNITLYEITVSDVLYSAEGISLSKGDIVTAGLSFNSYNLGYEFPIIENGKEFIMFCRVSANEYPRYRIEYSDYWMSAPHVMMIEKVDNAYLAHEYFKGASESSITLGDAYKIMSDNDALFKTNTVLRAANILKERTPGTINAHEYATNTMFQSYYLIEEEALKNAIINAANEYHKE